MKIKVYAIVLSGLLALSAGAAESTNRLHFAAAGFSIAPLEAQPGKASCAALMMCLPASGNFSANVNVQIQPYEGRMKEYKDLTMEQIKGGGITVVKQELVGKNILLLEYTGALQGQRLHWYCRAEKSGDHVYLATATTTAKGWEAEGARLKACVDSLHCDGGGEGAATNAVSGR
jgi:hypothetical protein